MYATDKHSLRWLFKSPPTGAMLETAPQENTVIWYYLLIRTFEQTQKLKIEFVRDNEWSTE